MSSDTKRSITVACIVGVMLFAYGIIIHGIVTKNVASMVSMLQQAQEAQAKAETAQAKAEAAQAAAESAQEAAEAAENLSTFNAELALGNATPTDITTSGQADITALGEAIAEAQAAQIAAETAQAKAEAAQTKAETAQTAAETAQTAAETAQTAAETAQSKAESAQTAAETAQTAAETAQSKAESAQTAAETAQAAVMSTLDGMKEKAQPDELEEPEEPVSTPQPTMQPTVSPTNKPTTSPTASPTKKPTSQSVKIEEGKSYTLKKEVQSFSESSLKNKFLTLTAGQSVTIVNISKDVAEVYIVKNFINIHVYLSVKVLESALK